MMYKTDTKGKDYIFFITTLFALSARETAKQRSKKAKPSFPTIVSETKHFNSVEQV